MKIDTKINFKSCVNVMFNYLFVGDTETAGAEALGQGR